MVGVVADMWGLFGGFAIAGLDLHASLRHRGCWPWQARKADPDPEISPAAYFTGEIIRMVIGAGLAWAAASTGRSVRGFQDITDDLSKAERQAQRSADPSMTRPTRLGNMFFGVLALFAQFEVDLLRARTREGTAVAKTKGKQPKLSPARRTW